MARVHASRGLFKVANHKSLPVIRCQSSGLLVLASSRPFARAVTRSSLSGDGVMIPVFRFQMHPIKLSESRTTAVGRLDLASATGRRFVWSIFRVSRYQVVTRSGGQSTVTAAASSMICRRRGELCSRR